MNLPAWISLFLFVLAGACRPVAPNTRPLETSRAHHHPYDPPVTGYQHLALDRLGSGSSCELNATPTMVLCQQIQQAIPPARHQTTRFQVISLIDNRTPDEDQLANARVEWHQITRLKIHSYGGTVAVVPGRPQSYYIIDVTTKQKVLTPAGKI
jgi:hypothetical protein